MVGLTVGPDGEPVVVIQTCEGYVDGVHLSTSAEDGQKSRRTGAWAHERRLKGSISFSLTRPAEGWLATMAPEALGEGGYALAAAGSGNASWGSRPVSFTAADLAALRPGQVRYSGYTDSAPPAPMSAVVTLEDYQANICKTLETG